MQYSISRLSMILTSTAMISFLSTYLAASATLALKNIGVELSVSAGDLSLVSSAYLLCTSLGLIPLGKISDRVGHKRMLLFACVFFALMSAAVPLFARDFKTLVALRGLQGLGAAMFLVSNVPIISMVFPEKNRAMALGVLSGMIYMGYSLGNFIGGYLIEHFTWHSIFYSAAICAVFAGALVFIFVPQIDGQGKKGKIDALSMLFYSAALISLQAGANRLHSTWGAYLLVLCAVSFVLFVARQLKTENPLYDVNLFLNNKTFATANIAVFFNFIATYGSQYLLPLYIQCNRGLSPSQAGKVLLIQPMMLIFFSPAAGLIADKAGKRPVAFSGMVTISIALVMLANLQENTSFHVIYLALALIGIGISFFSAPNTSIIMESVPREKFGMAASSNALMKNLGMQISIISCGAAFAMTMGSAGITPAQYANMLTATKACYAVFACLCIAGALMSIMKNKKSVQE